MKTPLGKALYWAPRVLGILLALFISLFALDVFEMEGTLLAKIGGFLIHLVPTYLLVIALAIGWRWGAAGGALFIVLAVLYLVLFGIGQPVWVDLIMASIPMLVGLLFLLDWNYRRRIKAA